MRQEPARRAEGRRFFGIGIVVVVLVIWLVWWQWDNVAGLFGKRETATEVLLDASSAAEREGIAAADEAPLQAEREVSEAERRWADVTGTPPVWPGDLAAPQDCDAVESEFIAFCARLDGRAYLQGANLPGGTCGLLLQAAEELAARPPELAELRSYPTLLGNIFHLYRVLGRERIALGRRILHAEQETAEAAAMAIFRKLASMDRCREGSGSTVRLESLYAYAGFMFQTMGGQAYLRRRSPRVEALASFYGLVVLDRALSEGYNPQGVDPRPEIQRARALIADQELLFGGQYGELLDDMARRWEARAEP